MCGRSDKQVSPGLLPSRASPLPQGISGVHRLCVHHGTLWERACPRRGQH
ncbi:hypothetical protein KW834_14510 [Pseudomonas sp. PDM29]|nr:hypothetical protein [Pseudomonas sp. PDM29]